MKEILSKKFWQDVKKTFDDARAETPPTNADSQAGADAETKPEPTPGGAPANPRTVKSLPEG